MPVSSEERVQRILTQAIAAVRAHEIPRARAMLNEVLREEPENEHGLLWFAAIADSPNEAKLILRQVLEINPENGAAAQALQCLRERTGELPIPKIVPASARKAPVAPAADIRPAPKRASAPTANAFVQPFPEKKAAPADSGTWRRVLRDEMDSTESKPAASAGAVSGDSLPCPFCGGHVSNESWRCQRCRAMCSLQDVDALAESKDFEDALVDRCVRHWQEILKVRPAADLHLFAAIGCFNLSRSAEGYLHLIESFRLDPNQAEVSDAVDLLKCRSLVLIIDHSAAVRQMVSGVLNRNKYLTMSAGSAKEGLAWIEVARPDLIYVDQTLQDMDGPDLIRDLRSRPELSKVPMLAVSHIHGFMDRMKSRVAGGGGFLAKPFQAPELLKEVRRLVREEKPKPQPQLVTNLSPRRA